MYGLLVTKERSKAVHDAIEGAEIWFKKIGVFSQDEFLQYCQSASLIDLQIFIVDMDCTDETTLLKGLRIFRSSRNGRIILLAPGRKPGNPTISALLALQVWDIVAPELESEEDSEDDDSGEEEAYEEDSNADSYITELIKMQIISEFGYGNAARWDTQTDKIIQQYEERDRIGKDISEKKKSEKNTASPTDSIILEHINSIAVDPPQLPEVKLLETIIGSVLVSVIGVERNVATTHTALLLANFLSERKYKVALVEANQKNDFEQIEYIYEGMKGYSSEQQCFSINGVDYYKSGHPLDMAQLKEKEYEYIILDLGSYEKCKYIEEFLRSDCQIVVGHGSEWRQRKLFDFSTHFKERDQSKWIYAVPYADSLTIGDIKNELGTGVVISIPAHSDPWTAETETNAALDSMMQDYLGHRHKSKAKNHYALWAFGITNLIVIIFLVMVLFQR